MKAGIDRGTTLTKFAWLDDGRLQLFSTANARPESILDEMRAAGIVRARTVGIGQGPAASGIIEERASGDPIADEIALQAAGVRRLLGDAAPEEFLLVSIGTGTSYTFVTKDGTERHPLGNAIGGGFIAGLAKLLRVDVRQVEANAAESPSSLDLLVKDVLPSAMGMQGEFVVAHFGKDAPDDELSVRRACASLLRTVAVSVVRDLMLFGMQRRMPADAVFIGSTVSTFRTLREHLGNYAPFAGLVPHFPPRGEYAAAIGALYAE